MVVPHVVILGSRAIRIDFPPLFQDAESQDSREFVVRGFELEEVVSMEINEKQGSAVVRLRPGHGAAAQVLVRLADRLEVARPAAVPRRPCPHFVLDRVPNRVVYARAPALATRGRHLLYAGLGAMFFGLSIVGVAMPLVPTTPFVILSSFFALRSSPALNDRLLRSRWFGPILRDWHSYRALRRSTKRKTLIFMIVIFALTFGLTEMAAPSLTNALAISLFSFGFVLQLPSAEDEPARAG